MDKTTAPGHIPEWAKTFHDLNADEKRDLARRIGVTVRAVQNWAAGKSKPSPMAARKIPAAFRRMGGRA